MSPSHGPLALIFAEMSDVTYNLFCMLILIVMLNGLLSVLFTTELISTGYIPVYIENGLLILYGVICSCS